MELIQLKKPGAGVWCVWLQCQWLDELVTCESIILQLNRLWSKRNFKYSVGMRAIWFKKDLIFFCMRKQCILFRLLNMKRVKVKSLNIHSKISLWPMVLAHQGFSSKLIKNILHTSKSSVSFSDLSENIAITNKFSAKSKSWSICPLC